MSGTILENLSGKKISILVGSLLVCQLICFLIGGLIGMSENLVFLFSIINIHFLLSAPVPANVQTILGTMCKDVMGSYNDTSKWVYSRGVGKCEVMDQNYIESPDVRIANQFVFVFQVN